MAVYKLAVVALLSWIADAQSSNPFEFGNDDGHPGVHQVPDLGYPRFYDDNGRGAAQNENFFGGMGGFYDSSSPGYRALVAHAVIASVVWVVLIPTGGILLRLGIRSPWIIRIHAAMQVISYLLYIVAVGLGIYLIRNLNFGTFGNALWRDPHPQLGLAILALALFQPFLGVIHHSMYKKRVENTNKGMEGPAPGRTVPGHMHLWLGRILIVLGMVNGGLGIRLATRSPFQSDNRSATAAIVYGVVAGVSFLTYLIIVIIAEVKRAKAVQNDQTTRAVPPPVVEEIPPTYIQSQESLTKDSQGATRYT